MNKKWEIYKADEQKIKKIEEKGINRLLATVLANRGITIFNARYEKSGRKNNRSNR